MAELRLGLAMPRKLPALTLDPSDQEQLERWLTAHGTPQQVVLRSRIILASALGQPESAIAEQLRVVPRPKKDDSAEVYIDEEFIGVMFVDDEEDERSYNFQMAILGADLE